MLTTPKVLLAAQALKTTVHTTNAEPCACGWANMVKEIQPYLSSSADTKRVLASLAAVVPGRGGGLQDLKLSSRPFCGWREGSS